MHLVHLLQVDFRMVQSPIYGKESDITWGSYLTTGLLGFASSFVNLSHHKEGVLIKSCSGHKLEILLVIRSIKLLNLTHPL